jgi:hypothetical protein
MKTQRLYIYILLIVLLIIGCNNITNDYSEIEIIEYRLYPDDLEGKFLHIKILQYANIGNDGKCQCLTYHCAAGTQCVKTFMIDKSELLKLLTVSLRIQHDTTMGKGFNGRPFIKFIVHYKDKVQTITIVRDRLDSFNPYVRFFANLDSNSRINSFDLKNMDILIAKRNFDVLIAKRNALIRSMCKKPYPDISLLPNGILCPDFGFKVDTLSN